MIVMTGAAGRLGSVLAQSLVKRGMTVRLSDIRSDHSPADSPDWCVVDLRDHRAVRELCRDATAIIHFGGISFEQPLDILLGANVLGTANVFDAAKEAGARVIYASSNHVVGFCPRGEKLTPAASLRPDSMYAVSKATGELIARYYFDRYGVQSAGLRIGSCLPHPIYVRHLHTWLSQNDLEGLVLACLTAPSLGCRVLWGVSANTRRWWFDDAQNIGYLPLDDSEPFAQSVSPDTAGERFQGGEYCCGDATPTSGGDVDAIADGSVDLPSGRLGSTR